MPFLCESAKLRQPCRFGATAVFLCRSLQLVFQISAIGVPKMCESMKKGSRAAQLRQSCQLFAITVSEFAIQYSLKPCQGLRLLCHFSAINVPKNCGGLWYFFQLPYVKHLNQNHPPRVHQHLFLLVFLIRVMHQIFLQRQETVLYLRCQMR